MRWCSRRRAFLSRPFANAEEPIPDYQETVLERFIKLQPSSGPSVCDTSPMGHKNCTAYLLDEAMSDLFRLCTDLDVPILSHATNSNSAAREPGIEEIHTTGLVLWRNFRNCGCS